MLTLEPPPSDLVDFPFAPSLLSANAIRGRLQAFAQALYAIGI